MGHILLQKVLPPPSEMCKTAPKSVLQLLLYIYFLILKWWVYHVKRYEKFHSRLYIKLSNHRQGWGLELHSSWVIPNDFFRLVGASSLLGEGSHLYVIYYLVWAGYSTLSEYLRNKLADASELQTGEDLCYWVDLGYSWLSCSYSGYLNFSLDFFSLLFSAFGLRDFSLYVIWL